MLALLGRLPAVWQAGLGLGLLAAAAAGYGLWHHKVYRSGYDAAIAAVAAQDREAIHAADSARDRIRACRASGGVWRSSTGQCERG